MCHGVAITENRKTSKVGESVQVLVQENGESVEYPKGISNDLLSIAFGIETGCEFVTGLEVNLRIRFSDAVDFLREDGQHEAVRRIDRYMRRYACNRFKWN